LVLTRCYNKFPYERASAQI